ncbi:hypothetical protein B7494_g3292 [Chlorociboria aeruginascens]|nr:hypothetical protein B7494_g3292 [Chlorociboria aeruginascens]
MYITKCILLLRMHASAIPAPAPAQTQTQIQSSDAFPADVLDALPPIEDFSISDVLGFESTASPYDSFSFPEIGIIDPEQLDFCITQLKLCIDSFILQTQTPFIHSVSYSETMPPAYQDVLSVCALYRQKTPENEAQVFRVLESKVDTLLNTNTTAVTIQDHLLALQALLIYQIIRIFDGDPRQCSLAEGQLATLVLWTTRLQTSYFEASLSSSSPFKQWILLESTRRTIMVSVLLRAFFDALKNRHCDLIPLMAVLPVCNNGRLWKLQELEWWRERERGGDRLGTYSEFTQEWNEGRIEGVEEYETILLVACRYAVIDPKLLQVI